MENLKELILRLSDQGCQFVIVGGFCAVSLGSSLVTQDVDVVSEMSSENLVLIWEALKELNPVHRMTPDRLPFTKEQAQEGKLKNLYLTTSLGQLDVLGEVKGIGGFSECWQESENLKLDSFEVRTLTIDALIKAKRAMGRPRDLHAVLELEAIRERRDRGE